MDSCYLLTFMEKVPECLSSSFQVITTMVFLCRFRLGNICPVNHFMESSSNG